MGSRPIPSKGRAGGAAGTVAESIAREGATLADAVPGLLAIAPTIISTMIAETRFPDFLAISLSLSRRFRAPQT
jgi:hypothetical protein